LLRRLCGPKKDEVTGDWRKLHNEKLYDPYSLSNIIRVVKSRIMRYAGHVTHVGDRRVAHRLLVRRRERKGLLGRPRRRYDNIKMDLQGVGWGQGLD
jgi:hypothetical protein